MAAARSILAGAAAALALAAALTLPQSPAQRDARVVAQRDVLDPWYQALADSDQAPATVVVLGDSVSEGFGVRDHLDRRWAGQLQDALREQAKAPGCPVGPTGYEGAGTLVPAWYAAGSLPDPQVRGEVEQLSTVGPGGRALSLAPGASVSWEVVASEVAIGYRTGPRGGDLEIAVDGEETLAGRYVQTEDEVAERRVWHSATGDLRTQTWTVRNASAARRAVVTDLTPFRGDRGRCVHVVDASHSGITARHVSREPGYVHDSVSMNPDLLVIALGFNDARAGTPPAALRTDLVEIVRTTRAAGFSGPVLITSWHRPPAGFFRYDWGDYRTVMRGMAALDGVSFVDVGADLPPVIGAPAGIYLDDLHPGPRGQDLIADVMTRTLTPVGPPAP